MTDPQPQPPTDDELDYVRTHYGVPAHKGRRVTVSGEPGVITGSANGGHHIRVQFDDGYSCPAHPTWHVDYEPSALDSPSEAGQ